MNFEKEDRLAWWREARFGMMITWGIYALKAAGEWVQYTRRIPIKEYEQLADQFNPLEFNAREWVKTLKDAGMKYLVITSKHHDGFAMFKSDVSPYNIVDATPFKRDPMAELSAACKEFGIKFCIYYSHVREWHHPHAQSLDPHNPIHVGNYGNFWDYPYEERKNLQIFLDEISKPQLKEALQKYDPALVWFDTPGVIRPDQAQEFYDLVHEVCPNCLVNSRIGYSGKFDYVSCGDNEIPDQRGLDFETPMVMNRSWGYNTFKENPYKPTEKLIQELVEIVSAGGNYLLNVGPDELGRFEDDAKARLSEIGEWLRIHGEAIYGTNGSPFNLNPKWGKITQKGKNLYLFIEDWQQKIHLRGVHNKIIKCSLLGSREIIKFELRPHGDLPDELILFLPETLPSGYCPVIRVELENEIQIDNRSVEGQEGEIDLKSRYATLTKNNESLASVSLAGVTEKWFTDDVELSWEFYTGETGEYEIAPVLQTSFYGEWDIGFSLVVECGGQLLSGKYDPPEGPLSKLCSYEKRKLMLGRCLLQPGKHRLTLSAKGVRESLQRRVGVTLAHVHLKRIKH